MKRPVSISVIFAAMLVAAAFSGCSSSEQTQQSYHQVWPEPPDSPRVAYLRTLRGEKDFSGGLGSIVGSLAGSETVLKFSRPFDICVAGDGRFYITDLNEGVILYDARAGKLKVLGEKSIIDLKDPRGIAYARGKVYIGLAGSKKIAVLDEEGKVVMAIGREGYFQNPVDIVCDTLRSRIYIVDSKGHQVFAYSETGDSLFTIGRRGEAEGDLNYPQSAAVDEGGNLYVVDGFNFRVQIFDSTGKYVRHFGKQGDVYGTFARPKGVALDSYKNIYVLDGMHQNFQIFSNEGELLMFVGKYSAGNDGFVNPVSIAIDQKNSIYVTDYLNSRVQVFQLLKGN